MVDRLLTGLAAQQKGTTARWYSNKFRWYSNKTSLQYKPRINALKYFQFRDPKNLLMAGMAIFDVSSVQC